MVGDRVIAMQLGVVSNKIFYVPKSAYNEDFAAFSPGHLINDFAIRDLGQNGFLRYDFLGPRAMWKMVWATGVREHSNCYIFRPTIKGRLLYELTMRAGVMARKLRHKVWGDPQEVRW